MLGTTYLIRLADGRYAGTVYASPSQLAALAAADHITGWPAVIFTVPVGLATDAEVHAALAADLDRTMKEGH